MKIVYLSPEAIVPTNTGGRIVVYNKIKYFALAGNEVYLFSIVDSDDEIKYQKKILSGVIKECHSYNRNSKRLRNLVNTIRYPYAVASRDNQQLQSDLQHLLTNEKIDYIICELPQMAINLLKIRRNNDYKCIMSQQNIEHIVMKNIGSTFNNPVKKIVYYFDSYRLKQLEKIIYHKELFDGYIFVSSGDKEFFEKNLNFNEKATHLVPIGSEEHAVVPREANNKNVLVVGKMSYQPNIDGILWFCNDVWNKVLREIPDAKLFIVGKDPSEDIQKLACENIVVTGTVDSVEPYYNRASVVSIPILSGGGVKTKLIEAASYRIPIVCTPFAIKGTDFSHGIHLKVSEDEEIFAQNLISIIKNRPNYDSMAASAYELFEKEYTWKGICQYLIEFLDNLAENNI